MDGSRSLFVGGLVRLRFSLTTLLLIALAAAAWPPLAAAQGAGRFSIDAQWTIASTPTNPYAGTLRFTVSGTAAKTPYGSIAINYSAPVLTGSLTSAPGGCIAPSVTLDTLSNGAPRVSVNADLDSTRTKVLLRFTVRYSWNLQCPGGTSSQLAGYEAVGACPTSAPCSTSAPAELPRVATDIYQLAATGPNRPDTTLALNARVSLVPVSAITSKLLNPNPALIDAQGQLAATTASAAALTLDPKAAAIGAVADGVSKLLVVVDTKDPVTLSLPTPAAGEPPVGTLTSLTGAPTIGMTPVRVQGGGAERDLVVAVYTPPAHFGELSAAAERTLPIAIASADQTVTQSIVLARPPLVLIHGLAAAPDDWHVFREQLAARGYPDTPNARRVWMTPFTIGASVAGSGASGSIVDAAIVDTAAAAAADALRDLSPSLANLNVQAVGGDIDQALTSYRLRGLAAAQVDLAGHGIGGLIARSYERTLRTLGRYITRETYSAGAIHRLITIGTPHDGSEWGLLANVPEFRPLVLRIASTLAIGSGTTGAAGSGIGSGAGSGVGNGVENGSDRAAIQRALTALAALAPGGAAYQRLGATLIPGGTHAIATTWAPDASASHALLSQWLGAAPEVLFCDDASDLIAAASSQLARRDAQSGGTLLDGTIHTDLSDVANPSGGAEPSGGASAAAATQAAGGKHFAILDALAALLSEAQTASRLPAAFTAPITRACPVLAAAGLAAPPATPSATPSPTLSGTPSGIPGDQPIDLSVTPASVALTDLNRVRRLSVLGAFSAPSGPNGTGGGGVMRDLSSPALGTSYTLVSGQDVVDLSAAGVITARMSGSAAIDVRHGALVKRINVTVACPAGPCLFLSPSTALASGGSVMRLYGAGFVPGTRLDIGGVPVPAAHVSVIDEHTLEFIAPAATTPLGSATGNAGSAAGGMADLTVSIPSAMQPSPSMRVLPAAVRYVAASADPAFDSDLDGMPDRWEAQFGLDMLTADGDGDFDGDGISNAAEFAAGTHPDGARANTRYLAEGATGAFFNTSVALFNPGPAHATAVLRFTGNAGIAARHTVFVPAGARRTIEASTIPGLANASFSTVIESDEPIAVDRTMTWGGGYGSHADTAIVTPSPFWFLAEGSTSGDFQLFYLLQNPSDASVSAAVKYLLPFGLPPIERTYTLPPNSRTTIAVDDESPALASTDVSAAISATAPIIVERAMYRSSPAQTLAAGHESAGVTSPATRWFLAEGATGPFFDLFILIANPNPSTAEVRVDYLLSTGETHSKLYTLAANSRFTIWVDDEELPAGSGIRPLANVAVSSTITSINDVPVVVERTMWWPGAEMGGVDGGVWTEAHNSPGATETGTAWALADGEVGGPLAAETYILIANTSNTSGRVMVTLHFEDGTTTSRPFELMPRSRANVQVSIDFPESIGHRFSAVVRGLPDTSGVPPDLVVERAMYTSVGDVWSGGTNAMGTRLR